MPVGGTLAVRAYTDHDEMCLDIRDSGDGIPEGVQVFAPFVTTKARGTGVGLFVAQRILSAHGGTIGYTSKKGEGTTFHLAFPIGRDEELAKNRQRDVSTIAARRL